MTLKDLHIWINKMHNILYKMLLFLLLFFSMLLLCLFFRLKELFQVKNGLTKSFLFFLENAKNLGRSDDATRRKKKRMALRKSSGKRWTSTFHRSRYREYFMESAGVKTVRSTFHVVLRLQSSFWRPFYFKSFQNAKICRYKPRNDNEIEVSAY